MDPTTGLVIVVALLRGPSGETYAELALDTGATTTMVNTGKLVSVGYDPAASAERVRVTTGSGVEYVARLPLTRLEALGFSKSGFPVVSHTLPPSASVDGVLGLDFLRGSRLTMDFRQSTIDLA